MRRQALLNGWERISCLDGSFVLRMLTMHAYNELQLRCRTRQLQWLGQHQLLQQSRRHN
jgi:hypothetical protein